MPTKALAQCVEPGCPARVKFGRCDEHQNAGKKWYRWARWRQLRAFVLTKNPFCVECAKRGHQTLAKDVDHIVRHNGNPERFWDADNLQGLCLRCHGQKSKRGE